MTIYSDHVVVLDTGEVAKVIDRSTNGKTLYVTLTKFGATSAPLKKVLASTARLATMEEIASSPFSGEFYLLAPEEKT